MSGGRFSLAPGAEALWAVIVTMGGEARAQADGRLPNPDVLGPVGLSGADAVLDEAARAAGRGLAP